MFQANFTLTYFLISDSEMRVSSFSNTNTDNVPTWTIIINPSESGKTKRGLKYIKKSDTFQSVECNPVKSKNFQAKSQAGSSCRLG